jgi:hypothetical protein
MPEWLSAYPETVYADTVTQPVGRWTNDIEKQSGCMQK